LVATATLFMIAGLLS